MRDLSVCGRADQTQVDEWMEGRKNGWMDGLQTYVQVLCKHFILSK